MPSLISTPTPQTFPLWDSFEAIFFVAAGVTIGFTLGYLFPSLWRTFRRRFRNYKDYTPKDINLTKNIKTNIKILGSFEQEDTETDDNKNSHLIALTVAQSFVIARNFFQEGHLRNAIKVYLDILVNENVSKQETNRALYEITQVYIALDLHSKAFETCFELLNRKPKEQQTLILIIEILEKMRTKDLTLKTLSAFKGFLDIKVRKKLAHHICALGEALLEKQNTKEAAELSRQSLQIDASSPRAMMLLTRSISLDLKKSSNDPHALWITYGADLDSWARICEETKISPAAWAEYLWSTLNLSVENEKKLSHISKFSTEFKNAFDFGKLNINSQKTIFDSIFYSFLLLEDGHALQNEQERSLILSFICGKNKFSQRMSDYLETPNFNISKLGFSLHRCKSCSHYFRTFQWHCDHCNSYESLVPIVSPFLELISHASESRNTHSHHSN